MTGIRHTRVLSLFAIHSARVESVLWFISPTSAFWLLPVSHISMAFHLRHMAEGIVFLLNIAVVAIAVCIV